MHLHLKASDGRCIFIIFICLLLRLYDAIVFYYKKGGRTLNLLTLLFVAALLAFGILLYVICREIFKNFHAKTSASMSMSEFINDESILNDDVTLAKYKAYIKEPLAVAYIQRVKG